MFRLVGALFLTKLNQDIGFPVFQAPFDNRRYTCALDRDLKIQQFLPAYTEKFSFLSCAENKGTFNLKDAFPFLLFRISGDLMVVDLSDIGHLEGLLEKYGS